MTDAPNPLGLVPSELPEEAWLHVACPAVETEHDVFRYQATDLMVKQIDKARLEQNKRLLNLRKAWDERKRAMSYDIVRLLREAPDHKLATMIGTIYQAGETKLGVEIEDEQVAALFMLMQISLVDHEPEPLNWGNEVVLEWRPHITSAGKEWLREAAQTAINNIPETADIDYDALLPGCKVQPERPIVVNRPRGKALSMEQLAALNLDEMLGRVYTREIPETPAEGEE